MYSQKMFENAIKIVQAVTGESGEASPLSIPIQGETMRAVVLQAPNDLSCVRVMRPQLQQPEDVVLRVLACSVSSSDVRANAGHPAVRGSASAPRVLGHECVGEVVEKGPDVVRFSLGDRVALAASLACGRCDCCAQEQFACCRETALSSHPLSLSTGCQAEFVRVSLADVNCLSVPPSVRDDTALFADVLCVALHAVDAAAVRAGDTVVLWGLGPIGLMVARWCQLRHAKRVVAVDRDKTRLDVAASALRIDVLDRTGTTSTGLVQELQRLLPQGADVCVECVGERTALSLLHTVEAALGLESETPEIVRECCEVAKPYGSVVLTGDYEGVSNQFPLGLLARKHLSLHTGRCSTQKYWPAVMRALEMGEVDPTVLLSHCVALEDLPALYEKAKKREGGIVKALVRP